MVELYNGDCLEVLKTIKDNSIDLIVTDPPYKVTSRGSSEKYWGGVILLDNIIPDIKSYHTSIYSKNNKH